MMKILLTLVALTFSAALAYDDLLLVPSNPDWASMVGDIFYAHCSTPLESAKAPLWLGPDNKPITSTDRFFVNTEPGEKRVNLFNRKVQMKDRGKYTCTAQINGREVRKQITLHVYRPIDLTGTPREQFLEEGRDSTIKCNADGDPFPIFLWRKDREMIKTEESEKYMVHPDNPNWLVVANASINDAGQYRCIARQINRYLARLDVFLIEVGVQKKPVGSKNHSNKLFSFVSGVVNLTCEAVAEPKANFTWLKDGNVMNDSEFIQIFHSDHKSIIEITVNDESMFGDYYCKAQNSLGTLERVVTLENKRLHAISEFQLGSTNKWIDWVAKIFYIFFHFG